MSKARFDQPPIGDALVGGHSIARFAHDLDGRRRL